MEGTASVLEIVLTLVMAVAVFGGLAVLALWGRRRRRAGNEATTSNAEGSEVILGAWRS